MASTFNLLTAGGARFNKEKYSSDFGLFKKPQGGSRKGKEKAISASAGKSTALPSSIDFFHNQPHSSHHPHHKPSQSSSRAHQQDDDEESDEDDDDDDDDEDDDEDEGEDEEIAPPQQKITLTGPDPLPKSLSPSLLSLISQSSTSLPGRAGTPLLKSLRRSNISSLWGVQCAVAGCLLDRDTEGMAKDVICVAPTGSGKTLSYVLPTIVNLRHPARGLRDARIGKEGSSKRNEIEHDDAEDEVDDELDGGRGIRSVVFVPTHDLAIQIQSVAKAVMAGRSWRVMVLTKATERAVCISSPGKNFDPTAKSSAKVSGKSSKEDDEEEEEQEDDEEEASEEEDEALSTGSVNEFAQSDDEDESSSEDDGDGIAETTEAPLGIDMLIATPERLHHLIQSKQISLAYTRHLIFDESDRLLSDDFKPQVLPILKAARHPRVQKCFLSATMPSSSEAIAKKWLRDGGVRVVVGVKDSAVTTVAQSLLYTGSESGKILALRNLLSTGKLPYPSLIFVQSVERAEELYKLLVLDSGTGTALRVEAVHGGKSLAVRDKAIDGFRRGDVWVLVVTEVLARGMDFRGVKVVVNYDFPQTVQSYIHRIGRTARAGLPGTAITFFSNEDAPHLRTIANVLRASGCEVPSYMLEMKKPSKNLKRFRAKIPVARKEVGGGGRDLGKERGKRKRDMIEGSKRRKVAKGQSGENREVKGGEVREK